MTGLNKKALLLALAISITLAIAIALLLAALIYFPVISLYIICAIAFSIAFIGTTFVLYILIIAKFDIL